MLHGDNTCQCVCFVWLCVYAHMCMVIGVLVVSGCVVLADLCLMLYTMFWDIPHYNTLVDMYGP